MNYDDLKRRVSELESINDQLLTELRVIDQLLREVGFEDGIKTMKLAAEELIEEEKSK